MGNDESPAVNGMPTEPPIECVQPSDHTAAEIVRMLTATMAQILVLQDRIVELQGDQKMLRDSVIQQRDGLKNLLASKDMWLIIGHGFRAFARDPDTWRAALAGIGNYIKRHTVLFVSIVSATSITTALVWIALSHRLEAICGL